MKTRLILIVIVALLAVAGGCGKKPVAVEPVAEANPHRSIWTQTTYSDGGVGDPIMVAPVPQADPNTPRPVSPTMEPEFVRPNFSS
jgi:hypothetical protein